MRWRRSCSIVQQPDNDAPSITWQPEPASVVADEILDTRNLALDIADAERWLHELLAESPAPANEIIGQAQDNGFSQRSIRRAFANLGCLRTRKGAGPSSVWVWALHGDRQRLADYRLDPITEIRLEREARVRAIINGVHTDTANCPPL